MNDAEELPGYVLNDPQAFISFLREAYRRRQDVVIRADDCQCLADALRERMQSSSYDGGGDLFS